MRPGGERIVILRRLIVKNNEKNLSKGDTEDVVKLLDNLRKTVSGNPRVYLDNTKAIVEESQSDNNCCEAKLSAKTPG